MIYKKTKVPSQGGTFKITMKKFLISVSKKTHHFSGL